MGKSFFTNGDNKSAKKKASYAKIKTSYERLVLKRFLS